MGDIGFIYKITNNINGKIYIGKTQLYPPDERWKEHIHDYKKERCNKRPLYDAMNKYGVENFDFQVIEEIKDDNILCEREKYYINLFRTYVGFNDCNGYNATLGGDGKSYINIAEQEIIDAFETYGIYEIVAKKFNIDSSTVKKIIRKNNIQVIDNKELYNYRYYLKYGGIAKVDPLTNKIIDIYKSPKDVALENPNYKTRTIGTICNKNANNGHYIVYGYYWYRMVDLPDFAHL